MGLFDRMKEVITVDISEKISYGTSIRKLAGEIKTNESEIRRLINQTGSRCVEKHLHETDTEYEDLFAEIRLLQDKNRSLSTQIQELKVQQAEADGIRFIREAGADDTVLKLKSLEAFEKAADGKATKIIIPSEIQNLGGLLASAKELVSP